MNNNLKIESIGNICKKRKKCKNNCKKRIKTAKITQKTIKTTQIDKRMQRAMSNGVDIFSLAEFYENRLYVLALSKYLSQKINSQICCYRGVKSATIVEIVAKRAIRECFYADIYNIDKYIINKYNLLYKKEMQILPYLLINECLNVMRNIIRIFNNYYSEIKSGAGQNVFKYRQEYSLAKIYGIAKYNPNLLKCIEISNLNIRKCVFSFINKLVWYQNKIHLIFKMIDNLQKYTTFHWRKQNSIAG